LNFSVLISVYDKEKPKFLDACLASIKNQTLPPTEVILVEDGPISDALISIIDSYRQHLNIVSVKISINKGLANALNVGIDHCSHDLVARMDSDDFCYPTRFQVQVTYMLNNPDVACMSCFVEEWDDSLSKMLSVRPVPISKQDVFSFIRFASPINHPACIYRKSSVLDVGCYPSIYPEDLYLWANLLAKGYVITNLPDRLMKMRAGSSMIKRRGLGFFWGEARYYLHLYRLGLTPLYLFIVVILLRFILRLSPPFIRDLMYRNFHKC